MSLSTPYLTHSLHSPTCKEKVVNTLYFFSLTATICAILSGYAALLAPIIVVIPWSLVYFITRHSAYFHDWSAPVVLFTVVGIYLFGLLLWIISLFILFSSNHSPFPLISLLLFLFWNWIHGALRVIKDGIQVKSNVVLTSSSIGALLLRQSFKVSWIGFLLSEMILFLYLYFSTESFNL
jgi:hypothetical protein